jgi:hypothetical protein
MKSGALPPDVAVSHVHVPLESEHVKTFPDAGVLVFICNVVAATTIVLKVSVIFILVALFVASSPKII